MMTRPEAAQRIGCAPASDKCLTVEYWNWGPVYLKYIKEIKAGTWKPGNQYWRTWQDGMLRLEPLSNIAAM